MYAAGRQSAFKDPTSGMVLINVFDGSSGCCIYKIKFDRMDAGNLQPDFLSVRSFSRLMSSRVSSALICFSQRFTRCFCACPRRRFCRLSAPPDVAPRPLLAGGGRFWLLVPPENVRPESAGTCFAADAVAADWVGGVAVDLAVTDCGILFAAGRIPCRWLGVLCRALIGSGSMWSMRRSYPRMLGERSLLEITVWTRIFAISPLRNGHSRTAPAVAWINSLNLRYWGGIATTTHFSLLIFDFSLIRTQVDEQIYSIRLFS